MTEIEVLLRLPRPEEPAATIECDTVLFEELRVAAQLGRCTGRFVKHLPRDHTRGAVRLVFTGRLTADGLAHLQQLQRRQRGDG